MHELEGPVRLPGASPLNRIGLRSHEEELSALVDRLAAFDRPVTESGMRLVHELVTDGGSPLYDRTVESEIHAVLARVLDVLEPH